MPFLEDILSSAIQGSGYSWVDEAARSFVSCSRVPMSQAGVQDVATIVSNPTSRSACCPRLIMRRNRRPSVTNDPLERGMAVPMKMSDESRRSQPSKVRMAPWTGGTRGIAAAAAPARRRLAIGPPAMTIAKRERREPKEVGTVAATPPKNAGVRFHASRIRPEGTRSRIIGPRPKREK